MTASTNKARAKRERRAIVCPEQLSSMNGATDERHCGSCAVCWSCDAPIVFVEH